MVIFDTGGGGGGGGGALNKFDMWHGHLSDRAQGLFLNSTGNMGLKTKCASVAPPCN